jgi:bifunctional non-homologous end joining protein LigD
MWRASAGKRRPPGYIEPCIPTRVSKPPVGPEWVHEVKHDGYRLIARKRDGRVRLFTRRGYDWTQRYPRIASAVAALRTASAEVDGEAVFCDGTGVADFERLHSRAYDDQVFLYAFDLLELDGEDWRPRPLAERKAKLSKLIAKAPAGIRYNEHLEAGQPSSPTPASSGLRVSSPSTASIHIAPADRRPGSRSRTQRPRCSAVQERRALIIAFIARDARAAPAVREISSAGQAYGNRTNPSSVAR